MPSLVYYGLDKIEQIPMTIPLIDRSEVITGQTWTFVDVLIKGKLDISGNLKINGTLTVDKETTLNNSLTVASTTWIKGDLYVNSTSKNQETVSEVGIPQNGGGNIYAGTIKAVSYAAKFRDLGERFEIDTPQPKGSIVMLGGEKEITLADISKGNPFGIIATNPAVKMNDDDSKTDETHPFICWCGRVPCRVTGQVKKFDKIILSNIPGVGIVHPNPCREDVIAIALESKDSTEEGLVEVVTQAKLFV